MMLIGLQDEPAILFKIFYQARVRVTHLFAEAGRAGQRKLRQIALYYKPGI